MKVTKETRTFKSSREKFLGLSLESSRKSYYPQLQLQYREAEEKQQRLQLLIDNLPVRIALVNRERKFILVNQGFEVISSMQYEQMVGRHVREVLGEETYTLIEPYVDEVFLGQQVKFEAPYQSRDSKKIWYDVTLIPVFDGQGEVDGYYVLARDLTQQRHQEIENKRLESQLIGAQKFKAMGTLAGGIAHDFNNLLMGIQGRSSLIGLELDPSHPLKEHIEAIDKYIASATHLTRQLLGLAQGGKYEIKAVDLQSLLHDCAKMFGRTRKEITIHHSPAADGIVVEVDRKQIEQVLLNLFVNAWHAMPDGGDLYLSLKPVVLSEIECLAYEISPGEFAMISVTDTGSGMTDEIRKRVFDPFFTTKEKQRGTGLGLASAYGIIKNHGGIIKVYSQLGQGTTFNVFLPLSKKLPQHHVQSKQKIQRGQGTLLLVDDEQMIREVSSSMLMALGYDVIAVESGYAAIEKLLDPEIEISMVILDMIMPNMDGGKTFDRLREIQPDLPVILSSGYSFNDQAENILKRGCLGFIQKPFSLSELSTILKDVLDNRG
jgi:two-component system, cell cycle sensor histidine kinase and response regulator CckA